MFLQNVKKVQSHHFTVSMRRYKEEELVGNIYLPMQDYKPHLTLCAVTFLYSDKCVCVCVTCRILVYELSNVLKIYQFNLSLINLYS